LHQWLLAAYAGSILRRKGINESRSLESMTDTPGKFTLHSADLELGCISENSGIIVNEVIV
jgi:hypothetical protein